MNINWHEASLTWLYVAAVTLLRGRSGGGVGASGGVCREGSWLSEKSSTFMLKWMLKYWKVEDKFDCIILSQVTHLPWAIIKIKKFNLLKFLWGLQLLLPYLETRFFKIQILPMQYFGVLTCSPASVFKMGREYIVLIIAQGRCGRGQSICKLV